MDLESILNVLKDYDLPTIILGVYFYTFINKKLTVVDKAVNCRPPDSMTISQEVSEIHRKVDVNATTQARNIEYLKNEMDNNKASSQKQFSTIGKDIKSLNKRVTSMSKVNTK
jgi:hypothetical protein